MAKTRGTGLLMVWADIDPEFEAEYNRWYDEEHIAHLLAVPGVTALHDLHIWGMSTTETALTCHLVMPQGHPGDEALSHVAHELEERFNIHHTTLQIELGDSAECALTPEHVV